MTLYAEPLVARATGVKKARLAELRHVSLEKGPDWTLQNSVVCYTEGGLGKLLRAAGVDSAAVQWPATGEHKETAAAAGELPEPLASTPDPTTGRIEPAEKNAPAAAASGQDQEEHDPLGDDAGTIAEQEDHFREDASPIVPTAQACAQIAAADVLTAEADLAVLRLARNPKILFAMRRDDGREVLVRVATNANFVRGMLLKARPPATGAGVYSFEGRCPRWKGHW
jgi:hypothetical protein